VIRITFCTTTAPVANDRCGLLNCNFSTNDHFSFVATILANSEKSFR
jgi:hypothetical protein